jgi:exodeoxyribonuclease VII small subunit
MRIPSDGCRKPSNPVSSRLTKTHTSEESSLEASLSRLEEIVGEIEKSPPPLEILIARYEEGMKLLKSCREKLDAAERRIEIIARSGRGEATVEPFETP